VSFESRYSTVREDEKNAEGKKRRRRRRKKRAIVLS
jgi:hypothetical protein